MREFDLNQGQVIAEHWLRGIEEGSQPVNKRIGKLYEEVGEMCAEIVGIEEGMTPDKRERLTLEVGDVFISLCQIANQYGVSLGEAVQKALEKNYRRANPAIFEQLRSEGVTGNLYQEAKKRNV